MQKQFELTFGLYFTIKNKICVYKILFYKLILT